MMSVPRPTFASLFCLVFFFTLSFCHGSHSILCPEIEKQALLTFKHSIEDPWDKLSSWNSQVDCCKWNGVVCNNLTGQVHELSLKLFYLVGRLHPSLLNLKHLTSLELSPINFFREPIPSFIGSFVSLQHLDLSTAGLYGTVPHTFGNLSKLQTLHFAEVDVDSFEWLSRLSHLEELNMTDVNMSTASNWAEVMNSLPSLVHLSITGCTLDITTPLHPINISTSLTTLDLSNNHFGHPHTYVVPSWIFQVRSLISLNLQSGSFRGPIPTLSNLTKIQRIDLKQNYFNSMPDWFYSCKDLEFLDFTSNNLQNNISDDIKNLSSLKTLNLASNKLSGKIPNSFGNMSYLEFLDLSNNQFYGAIPTTLLGLSSLKSTNLGYNKLTGNLPQSLGQAFNLEFLSFENNLLEGVVTEMHFVNLTNLKDLIASKNHLTLKVNPSWVPPFKLKTLELGSWNVGTSFPTWIKTQKSIWTLDLSKTGIYGTIPNWVWNLVFLDLSNNQLNGTIPETIPPPSGPYAEQFMYLSSNRFNGSLPRVTDRVSILDLSNNSFSGDITHFFCDMTNTSYGMQILVLSDNELSGTLPSCLMNWTSLTALILDKNKLVGSIPSSIGLLTFLVSLNIYNNKVSGYIPSSILNCTYLQKIDLSHNDLAGNIPMGMGMRLGYLTILMLGSNRLSGELSSDICHLNHLKMLDLSNNKFSGRMPPCVGNFTAMATPSASHPGYWGKGTRYIGGRRFDRTYNDGANITTKGRELLYDITLSLVTHIDLSNNNFFGNIPKELTRLMGLRFLNLSNNGFIGSIPDNIGDMKQLESVDLSRNSLSGGLPNSFTVLSFLSNLNVSYNNLSGRIPDGTQLRGLDPSSFIGNNLCGPPLTNNCSNDHVQVPRSAEKEGNKGHLSEVQWLYAFVSLGYAVGLSAVFTVLVLNKTWREALFRFVEDVCDQTYAYFLLKWRRLGRR